MAYSPQEKYPGAVDTDPNYKDGKFRDNNPSTTNNGSPLKAIDRNELLARDEAIMNDAGFEYNGQPDTPQNSQLFQAYKASLGNGTNLLSNHNFLIASPDDSQPPPDATPRSYPPGFQIFSGVFANETSGITNLTYVDGRVSFSGGDFYMPVANTGAIARLTAADFVASVADFDGKPRTRGVSFALVGNEYRVTVSVDALEDVGGNATPLGSVKFEQGGVATGHVIISGNSDSTAHNRTTVKESLDSADKLSSVGFIIPNPTDDWLYLDKAVRKVAEQQGVQGQSNLEMLPFLPFAGYNLLDLNGRTLTLDRPLDLPSSSGFGITNGCLTVTDNYTVDDFIIQTTPSGEELDLHKFALINVLLHGKRRANLFAINNFLDCHVINCHGYALSSIGVHATGGSVSHELYVSGGKWEKNTYKDNQSGLDNSGAVFLVDAFDCDFKPAFVGGIEEAFVFGRNEPAQFCSIDNVHIATGINMETGILVNQNSIQGFSACGNYIDGCKVILENCTGSTLNRNRFLNSSASRPSDNFVELRPTSIGQTLSDFTAKNNKFISNGNQFEAFHIDETNGTFTSVNNGTEIESNSRNGNVTLKQLVASGGRFISGGNQAVFDFSDELLLDPNFSIPGVRDASFTTNPSLTTTISGTTVTVNTGSTITGSVDLEVRRRG